MKKVFSKLMLVALAALAFTACEDVPEPYDIPGTGTNKPGSTEIEGATGDGSLDNPFNVAAAMNYGNNLKSGETIEEYVYIKGKVVSIKEEFTTQYGNGTFYISDDGTTTNQFYAYRVSYLGNKKFTASDEQIKVGDEVIVCGKITNYNGTIETAQNSGSFLYSLNGVNRGGEPNQGNQPNVEPKGNGTQADPYNVSAVLNFIATLGADKESTSEVYVKGIVTDISEEYGTEYGNASFTITDDGEGGSAFTCYRVKYLGNKRYTSGDKQIKKGDEVIVCGKVVNFKGNTPETVQNTGYLYSLNGNTGSGDTPGGEAKGKGTLEDPYNSVAANAAATALGSGNTSSQEFYIKGKVVSIATDKNGNVQNFDYGTFGNATFYISDDGTEADKFYCYRVLYLGNKQWVQGAGDVLKVGDEVIVCGKLTNYNGTPETAQNAAYLYSLNGKTEGSGGGGGDTPTPQPGEGTGEGTLASPYNSVAANAIGAAMNSGDTSSDYYYIKGKVSSIATDKNGNAQNFDFGTYGNASFYISDDGTEANQFYCFRVLYLGNKQWVQGAGDLVKVGDEVVVCAKITNYNGTPETKQGDGYLYSLNGKTEGSEGGGGGQGEGGGDTPATGTGSYSEPYSISAVIANGTSTTVNGVYVKGYIVGWIEGQVLASGAHFDGESSIKTNILVADNAAETDVNKCIPVQLPNGAVRTGLNIQDNPQFYGKEVLLYGNLEKYFGAPGVKSVTYAECNGQQFGTKP